MTVEGHALAAEAGAQRALLGFLAHDLRTPLGPLALAVTSIAEHPASGDDVRDLARFADAQTRRIGRLIDAVLWAARGTREPDGESVLTDLVAEAAALVRPLGLVCEHEGEAAAVPCARTQLRDALALLLEVAAGDEGRAHVEVRAFGGDVEVRVRGAGTARAAAEVAAGAMDAWRAVSVAGARAVVATVHGSLVLDADAIVLRLPEATP